MTKKMSCLIFLLFSLIWISNAVAGSQTESNELKANEEILNVEKGAYDIPLGVKLADFLKWCSDNNVKMMNNSKKAIEKEVKETLVNKLECDVSEGLGCLLLGIITNEEELAGIIAKNKKQGKKIMSYKIESLKELLVKLRDGKSDLFSFIEFDQSASKELLAKIEYIQGPLFLFRYGNEEFILENFFNSEEEIENIIWDKIKYPRGKDSRVELGEEVDLDIFRETMAKNADLSEKLFKSRYRMFIDLQNQEAKDNGIDQIEILFFRDQSDELKSYAAIYYCSQDHKDILTKSLTAKYGRPKINNYRDSINEISSVENICRPMFNGDETSGWKDKIFIFNACDQSRSPVRLVYHETVLWPRIRSEFENMLDNALENYKKTIKIHGDQLQNRL